MPYDANPILSYDQSLYWLIKKLPEADLFALCEESEPLPLVVQFMCDLHWCNPSSIRKDIRKKIRELS
ncbi:hypothetical protein J2X53_003474 [Pseudorhodobacter sp. 4114]|nr:hypothetical protein [Pseudorhodobacter sp. 4114]